jgi:hypothetical protein
MGSAVLELPLQVGGYIQQSFDLGICPFLRGDVIFAFEQCLLGGQNGLLEIG